VKYFITRTSPYKLFSFGKFLAEAYPEIFFLVMKNGNLLKGSEHSLNYLGNLQNQSHLLRNLLIVRFYQSRMKLQTQRRF